MTKYKLTKILLGDIVIATEINNKIKIYIRTGINYVVIQNCIGNLNEYMEYIKEIIKKTSFIYGISDKIKQEDKFIFFYYYKNYYKDY